MTASKSLGVLAAIALAALVLAAAATTPALAGKPDHANQGNGKSGECRGGPKKCGDRDAIVTVIPNPVPIGSQSVDISGSGFAANEMLGVGVVSVCCDITATTDAEGSFRVTFERDWDWPATYQVDIRRGTTVIATTTFTVE